MSPVLAGRFFTTEPPGKSKEEITVLILKKKKNLTLSVKIVF